MAPVVLGIDPSLNSTGWAVVRADGNKYQVIEHGSVRSNIGGKVIDKIKKIGTVVCDIVKKHNIKIVAIEESFVSKNASSSLKLGMVRGGCIAVCAMLDAEVFEYSPREVKLTISGKGSAQKEQLTFMLSHIIDKKLTFKNSDESDAVCIALTHLFRY